MITNCNKTYTSLTDTTLLLKTRISMGMYEINLLIYLYKIY